MSLIDNTSLAVSVISPLFGIDLAVLYGFAINNLIMKPFMMVAGVKVPGISAWVLILDDDFRELIFCGPFEPCFPI